MKRFVTAAFAAAILSSAATAGEPIWDKVEFGMTRAQVEALYPKSGDVEYQRAAIEIADINILEKCDAEVNIRFDDAGVVNEVMVAGNPSMGGRCSNKVLAALASKYGEPLSKDESFGTILSRQGKMLIWNRPDGVTMQFKKYESGFFGGGGLGKASWELTYTRLGDAISL